CLECQRYLAERGLSCRNVPGAMPVLCSGVPGGRPRCCNPGVPRPVAGPVVKVLAAMPGVAIRSAPPASKTIWSSCCLRFLEANLGIGARFQGRPKVSAVLGIVQAHLPVALRVFVPALAHLDEQEEVNRSVDHLGDLFSRGHRDLLDGRALGAERDLLLAVAHDIDGLLDADAAVGKFLPGFGLDRETIGKL